MSESLKKTAKAIRQKPAKHRGILDPANAAKNFQLIRYLPSPTFVPFVEHYWIIRWDLRGQGPYTSEVLPYPNINLAFTKDRTWITGVTTGKYDYELKGSGVIVGVMFKAGAFYAFWPHPMNELTDKTMPVGNIFPEADESFRRHLLRLNDDREIVARLEDMLWMQNPRISQHVQLASKIIETITNDAQLQTVQVVARRFEISERTLQHLFQLYIGVGVKWVIMRFRLQEAAKRIAEGERNWTSIAAELGYSDQAHFARDFKKIVGKSPSEYLKGLQA
jgi:AraC-like DNA-binding protein